MHLPSHSIDKTNIKLKCKPDSAYVVRKMPWCAVIGAFAVKSTNTVSSLLRHFNINAHNTHYKCLIF